MRFEEHEVDEHEGAQERCFDLDVQIEGESDAKIVGVGEGLAQKTRPLLGHRANLVLLAQVQHLREEREVGERKYKEKKGKKRRGKKRKVKKEERRKRQRRKKKR